MLLWIECAGPRSVLIECDVCREWFVFDETMDIGRDRERDARGGRARTGEPYGLLLLALFARDTEDSTEWVCSDGDVGSAALASEMASLDELATLVMLVCGFAPTTGRKDGLGGMSSSVESG